jgi:predicted peroxiredoxin
MSITANETNNLVVLVSRGLDDERATVAWTLANAGVASGQNVTVFCVSSGADLVRNGAADRLRMNPDDPSLKDLIDEFMRAGGTVWVCPPCASLRGYDATDLIDGVEIVGAGPFHDLIKSGASTICL